MARRASGLPRMRGGRKLRKARGRKGRSAGFAY